MNIFFTSDTHYHHKNLVRGCSEWEGANESNTRNFDTLEEHDAVLVQNINKTVKENDILYHLGDWSFGGIDQIWNFRKQLICKNIHFVLGNHDHHIENNKLINVDSYDVDVKMNVQVLFKSVNQYIRIKKINGQEMSLSHFAQRVWEKGHHGTWSLYGHSHGTLPDYHKWPEHPQEEYEWETYGISGNAKFKAMDVGIDCHPEFRPYHFDEIAEIMKNRINLKVDHHNEKTTQ